MEKALIKQLKNTKFSKPIEKSQTGGCYYTLIPRVVKHKGMHSEDLTIMNIDKMQLLESILTTAYEGDEDSLLGELQFTFVAFLDTSAADKGVTALLDESWLSSDSFLHHLCKDFFPLVLEAPVIYGDLLIWTRKLKELLKDSLEWQFNENRL
ncbi:unnamed protein product [Fraxinus pennsylvanica]|uniref:AAR2 C-terminal domain-containing protein n=1 Tax=Fraxinus pennsylvanica TaxID=56036 RepID=A0AAD2DIF2_9LAMI|nr:unnamed protein product [Fraxinus pennsylvanica]